MDVQIWADALARSLEQVWLTFASYLPQLVGALIVFIVGLIVASGLGALVERVLQSAKADYWFEKTGVGEYVRRAGMELNVGKFLGGVVYWFLLLAFLLATSDILGLDRLSDFIRTDVLEFIPIVLVAVLIMLAAVVLANFLKNVVRAALMSAGMHAVDFLGALAWWSVTVFGFFAALIQLGIAREIILTLVTGLIAMLSLAGGLAFGLGGKDYAAHLLKRFQEQVEGRR